MCDASRQLNRTTGEQSETFLVFIVFSIHFVLCDDGMYEMMHSQHIQMQIYAIRRYFTHRFEVIEHLRRLCLCTVYTVQVHTIRKNGIRGQLAYNIISPISIASHNAILMYVDYT